MQYNLLGSTGIKVSLFGMGTMGFEDSKRKDLYFDLIQRSFDKGINFFDTAEAYCGNLSEELLGEGLEKLKIPRSDIVISTKLFYGKGYAHPHSNQNINSLGLSRKHLIEGALASLKRLRTDYIDVLFCHRYDPDTPLEETCRAMNWLIENGKTLYWGTCEWSAVDIRRAEEICERYDLIKPQVEQIQYNLLEREKLECEYLPLISSNNRKVCVWSILAGGSLADTSPSFLKIEKRNSLFELGYLMNTKRNDNIEKITSSLRKIAKQYNCTLGEFVIGWALKNKHICSAVMGWKKGFEIEEAMNGLMLSQKINETTEAELDLILDNKPQGIFNWKNMDFDRTKRD